MDYGFCLGAAFAEGEHMRHNVVAHLVLVRGGGCIVNIVYMPAHFGNLFLGNGNSKLTLAFSKSHPEPAPGGKLAVVGKNALHFLAGIAGAKWVDIKFMIGHTKNLERLFSGERCGANAANKSEDGLHCGCGERSRLSCARFTASVCKAVLGSPV